MIQKSNRESKTSSQKHSKSIEKTSRCNRWKNENIDFYFSKSFPVYIEKVDTPAWGRHIRCHNDVWIHQSINQDCRNVLAAKVFMKIFIYYRIWVENYAVIVELIYQLLRKNESFVWNDEQRKIMIFWKWFWSVLLLCERSIISKMLIISFWQWMFRIQNEKQC